MDTSQKASMQNPPDKNDRIPTLDVPASAKDSHHIRLEAQVNHMTDELQAIFQQHLYQAMVKTLHQVVRQEGQKLSARILDKLQQQLPDIIAAASNPEPGKQVSG